jgi:hypothetical protein
MYETFEETDPLPLDQKLKEYGREAYEKIAQIRDQKHNKNAYDQA